MSERVATLVSVNVGLPRDVEWRGRTVHTGIWKTAVDGPCRARRLNLDGDGQGDLAGHGGEQRAVYVYQLDSYRYWGEHLGRDDFVPGQFGENFTVDGLGDDAVCIGDRYRIGTALFEVTQPRVTCYRVGLRMDEPRMPALLTGHGRPGFYLRVLEEGDVQAGDGVVKVADGPERMTVAAVNALLYLGGDRDPDLLRRALRIPALSPGWQGSLRALLDEQERGAPGGGNAGLTATAPPPAWAGFRSLRVAAKRFESADVISLDLDAPDGEPLARARPGQFVTLRLDPGDDRPPLVRSYSLSGPPGGDRYRISVKVEPRGAAGHHLRDAVAVGDRIDVAAPRGHFTLDDGPGPVALVSAGVGITPVLAMLHALRAGPTAREVWWFHGARNRAEHAFAEEVAALLAALPGARGRVWYSRPDPGDRVGVDYDETGRLTADALAAAGMPDGCEIFLCGPPAFMAALQADLAAHGVAAGRVHTEAFGAEAAINPGVVGQPARPPHPPAGDPGTGPLVSFARTGLNVPWDDRFASVLELAEACDLPVRWSCRTGVCHTCETGLLDGAVAYDPEPLEPPGAGNLLVCCARPRTPVAVDL